MLNKLQKKIHVISDWLPYSIFSSHSIGIFICVLSVPDVVFFFEIWILGPNLRKQSIYRHSCFCNKPLYKSNEKIWKSSKYTPQVFVSSNQLRWPIYFYINSFAKLSHNHNLRSQMLAPANFSIMCPSLQLYKVAEIVEIGKINYSCFLKCCNLWIQCRLEACTILFTIKLEMDCWVSFPSTTLHYHKPRLN